MMFGRSFEGYGMRSRANCNGHSNGNGDGQKDESFYGRGSPVMQNLRSRFGVTTFGNYRGCFQIMEILLEEDPNNLFRTVNSPHFRIAEGEFLRLIAEAERDGVVGTVPIRQDYEMLCVEVRPYRKSNGGSVRKPVIAGGGNGRTR